MVNVSVREYVVEIKDSNTLLLFIIRVISGSGRVNKSTKTTSLIAAIAAGLTAQTL
jgi:hypothetical protein